MHIDHHQASYQNTGVGPAAYSNKNIAAQDPYHLPMMYLSRKSDFAYVKMMMLYCLFLGVVVPVMLYSVWIGCVLLLLWLCVTFDRFMRVRSHRLFYDNEGVWMSAGYLPWAKSLMGVKWRDLDEAVFFNSLMSWAMNSHAILLKHRFTQNSEILLADMKNAGDAVTIINHVHNHLIQSGRLK
jgi:hypothetical protein